MPHAVESVRLEPRRHPVGARDVERRGLDRRLPEIDTFASPVRAFGRAFTDGEARSNDDDRRSGRRREANANTHGFVAERSFLDRGRPLIDRDSYLRELPCEAYGTPGNDGHEKTDHLRGGTVNFECGQMVRLPRHRARRRTEERESHERCQTHSNHAKIIRRGK